MDLSEMVMESPEGLSKLCESCVEFVTWIAKPGYGDEFKRVPRPEQRTCSFCEMIIREASRYPYQQDRLEARDHKFQPVLRAGLDDQDFASIWRASSRRRSDQARICHVVERNCFLPLTLELAVWADEGSPACQTFVSRPPILGPYMKDVCALADSWLSECKSHAECPSMDVTILPTRILALSRVDENSQFEIRLMESDGRQGRYIALSHCWGPEDKMPLRTTNQNFQEHLSNIAFDRLGKTFQDVVTFAYGTGINFVWIDSLCILQGDSGDWHKEAQAMRDVYRNATLVVLASGARDGSEGLFIDDRKPAVRYYMPYVYDNVKNGVFNLTVYPSGDINPTLSPLGDRAWAFQERLLARRIVAFMPGGITWDCKGMKIDECGHHRSFWLFENQSWYTLLESYTSKAITYPSDRIEALQGVVAEFSTYPEYREDHFFTEYGVWQRELERQLLWRYITIEAIPAPLVHLPTWSWAATGGGKVWVVKAYVRYWEKAMSVVRIEPSGALYTKGNMSTRELTTFRVSLRMYHSLTGTYKGNSILNPFPSYCGQAPHHFIYSTEAQGSVFGIAIYDYHRPIPLAKCFFMIKRGDRRAKNSEMHESGVSPELLKGRREDQYRKPLSDDNVSLREKSSNNPLGEPSGPHGNIGVSEDPAKSAPKMVARPYPSDIHNFLNRPPTFLAEGVSVSKLAVSDGAEASKPEPDEPRTIDSGSLAFDEQALEDLLVAEYRHLEETAPFKYWALLLEPVGDNRYKRVGIAMLYPNAYQALGVEVEEFEIV